VNEHGLLEKLPQARRLEKITAVRRTRK